MRRKVRNSLIFILFVLTLQQTSYWLGQNQSAFSAQKSLIIERDIDPSVFFYTESDLALGAEKKIRQAIKK